MSGAGRKTSGDAPAANMTIYLKNEVGNILSFTTTAPDGTYSFSNLAEGGYYVYPENYKYYTTPSALLTLAPGSDTAIAVNFKQHTSFGTITPYSNSGVKPPIITTAGISIFPNPASGKLVIQWSDQSTGPAAMLISDLAGRTMINTTITINTPSGQAAIDLSGLNEGIYMVNIRSATMNYTSKITLQQKN